jgi:hypothetical protein
MEIEVFTNCDSLWRDNLMHNVFLYTDGESTKKNKGVKEGEVNVLKKNLLLNETFLSTKKFVVNQGSVLWMKIK